MFEKALKDSREAVNLARQTRSEHRRMLRIILALTVFIIILESMGAFL
jgi:t-SNARE complex subunit (syntaxin)